MRISSILATLGVSISLAGAAQIRGSSSRTSSNAAVPELGHVRDLEGEGTEDDVDKEVDKDDRVPKADGFGFKGLYDAKNADYKGVFRGVSNGDYTIEYKGDSSDGRYKGDYKADFKTGFYKTGSSKGEKKYSGKTVKQQLEKKPKNHDGKYAYWKAGSSSSDSKKDGGMKYGYKKQKASRVEDFKDSYKLQKTDYGVWKGDRTRR
jgi:hypothetical protein